MPVDGLRNRMVIMEENSQEELFSEPGSERLKAFLSKAL